MVLEGDDWREGGQIRCGAQDLGGLGPEVVGHLVGDGDGSEAALGAQAVSGVVGQLEGIRLPRCCSGLAKRSTGPTGSPMPGQALDVLVDQYPTHCQMV